MEQDSPTSSFGTGDEAAHASKLFFLMPCESGPIAPNRSRDPDTERTSDLLRMPEIVVY